MNLRTLLLVLTLATGAATCDSAPSTTGGGETSRTPTPPATLAPAPTTRPRVVKVYPHDPAAFTQGLVFHDGFLYESTGQNGRSSIRRVALETGEVVASRPLDFRYFGEGLTELDGRFLQLTWQARTGFVYDTESLAPIGEFAYTGEGWGLTDVGPELVMSDGTHVLRFLDGSSFAETRRLPVLDSGVPVVQLNELEFVRGEIYANVWHSDRIARVDPVAGRVLGWLDLSGLLAPGEVRDPEAVLNGIAWDEAGDRLFVTGKLWPKLFEIDTSAAR